MVEIMMLLIGAAGGAVGMAWRVARAQGRTLMSVIAGGGGSGTPK